MKFKSKSHTLKSLKLKNSIIPDLIIIKCSDYIKNPQNITAKINIKFKNKLIAIRSSFKSEDTSKKSNAGKYKSFLNIPAKNKIKIGNAIDEILRQKKNLKNEVFFVQEMVSKIKISGVLLTRNLENYVKNVNINYFEGNKTDVVTSGKDGSKSIEYFENKKFKLPKKFLKLYKAFVEIRNVTKLEDFDIEFAIGKNEKVYILQVRKLIVPKSKKENQMNLNIFFNLEKKLNKLKQKHPDLFGKTTYFGVMPDWNPAEIIGSKPKPLALSLYQELITDHVWAQNRSNYGYKELDQFHLMTTFYGTPYVDIRIDFNSWLPKNLDKRISKKIINYYLKKFNSDTSLHDKIEFELLFTCITFSTKNKIFKKLKNVLKKKEMLIFYNELKKINKNSLLKKEEDIRRIEELKKKQSLINKSNLYEIDKIYWLIEDCKKYGTFAFAGLARCGFIGMELLNSLVEIGSISEDERNNFLNNINTVTSKMKEDLNKLSKKEFIKIYGHLRPGTYEITSLNYKNGFKEYFGNNLKRINRKTKTKKIKLAAPLNKIGIYNSNNELFNFIRESIINREYSKFIFSKSIDLIFENLIKLGKRYKINKEDLSFIKINKIMEMYFNLTTDKNILSLKRHIKDNRKEYISNKNIFLPDVIRNSKDLFIQIKNYEKINFISNKSVTSKVVKFNKEKIKNDYGCIVCIENADPGYDFLFNKNIKGLITKYGGLNSHMAIRCAELNIPSLIGVGEKNYNKILGYKNLNINCSEKKINYIN